jgi:predicted membrane protein
MIEAAGKQFSAAQLLKGFFIMEIVLVSLLIAIIAVVVAYLVGVSKGRKKSEAEYMEERLRRAESDKAFQREKESIMKEVLDDAEKKKAHLSNSGNGVDKFDAINDSLRNNKN